jgi:hypothetical protein
LQRFRIRGVPQKGTFTLDTHKALVLELFEVVGKSRIRDVQFLLDITDYKPVGMRGKQQPHDPQAGLGPHGRQHIRILGDLIRESLVLPFCHISIFAEIGEIVN